MKGHIQLPQNDALGELPKPGIEKHQEEPEEESKAGT